MDSEQRATDNSIPYGYCHCGCGEKTRVPQKSDASNGLTRGVPLRFINGHQSKGELRAATYDISLGCFRIPLATGMFALIDAEDVDLIARHNWTSRKDGGDDPAHYAVRTEIVDGNRVLTLMHRAIMAAEEGELVDHISGDTLDNRRSNLRIATKGENNRNQIRIRANNTTGYRGVSIRRDGRKFTAAIKVDGISYHLGIFDCPVEAAVFRDVAALELHGEFASLNFPQIRELEAAK